MIFYNSKTMTPKVQNVRLKSLDPVYIIPTHCKGGGGAAMHIEKEMPDKFLLNMSGTKMTFAG